MASAEFSLYVVNFVNIPEFLAIQIGVEPDKYATQIWTSNIFYVTVEDIMHFTEQGWFYNFLALKPPSFQIIFPGRFI